MKNIVIVFVISLLSKFLGFFREIQLSYYYGTSIVTDAFFMSFIIPGTIFTFITAGISTAIVPMYNEILRDENIEGANNYLNNILTVLSFFFILLIIILEIYMPNIIKIISGGFSFKAKEITVLFTRIMLINLIMSLFIQISTSYLSIKNKYALANFVGLISNVSIIGFTIIAYKTGKIVLLPIGVVLGLIIQCIFFSYIIKNNGFSIKLIFKFRNKRIFQTYKLAIPIMIGMSLSEISTLIDRMFASNIMQGGVAILNYSSRLYLLIINLVVISILSVMYPKLSRFASQEEYNIFEKVAGDMNKGIIGLLIPITFFSLFFSRSIINFLYNRGAFTEADLKLTSGVFFCYSLGLIFFGIRESFTRILYAFKNTKAVSKSILISLFINIMLNFILKRYLGLNGLALATSISGFVGINILYNEIKKINEVEIKEIFSFIELSKLIIISVLACFICFVFYKKLWFGYTLGIIIAFTCFIILYIILYYNFLLEKELRYRIKDKFCNLRRG